MMSKRVILIVLDSVGIGALPDAAAYGDEGANTLRACHDSGKLRLPTLEGLGLYHIDGMEYALPKGAPRGCFARMAEVSRGKDTTIGHWEIAGVCSDTPLPTYPQGFPEEILHRFREETGREILCNRPSSGTEVLEKYGGEHMDTGALIVYTSADSVFQVAAHEEVVPLDELYACCKAARRLLTGNHAVGRVIARPFVGSPETGFIRTPNRHDYSLPAPRKTICDYLTEAGIPTTGVGKISDIFAGRGIENSFLIKDNSHGMEVTTQLVRQSQPGFLFVNLVDFDMRYGHRNDIPGYTEALNAFDRQLGQLLPQLDAEDILILTADHGCDPSAPGTDHSREYTPMLITGSAVREGINLSTRDSFSDIAATIRDIYGLSAAVDGQSFWNIVKR